MRQIPFAEQSSRTGSFNSRTLGRVRHRANDEQLSSLTFQFTHPGKGATDISEVVTTALTEFQFTHPGKGATLEKGKKETTYRVVSIHAPWEGCDTLIKCSQYGTPCFNSRTLGRVRLSSTRLGSLLTSFNSRTLGRVRPCPTYSVMHVSDSFNSRTLGRVRPLLHFQTRGLSSRFNSRTLGRVRHVAAIRQG